ncbi:hypothetical protein LPJ53_000435 [Coemansia erecta]|uniref:Phosphoglycerate mutase-like protein n=1 Tax=Coemansia erecta TaxID=147472 RepID=A0A9W8CVZ6_9FUNG|nr:hypothetical protein LPJ53_000435 [Coemansia erecta]
MAPSPVPSNSEATAQNATQARLPKLTADFIAKHYPRNVSVVHVNVINRHGERTPGNHKIPAISPEHWNLCEHGNTLHGEFLRAVGLLAPQDPATGSGAQMQASAHTPPWHNFIFNKETRDMSGLIGASSSGKGPSDGSVHTAATCAFGQLTDLGRASMTALGAHMRALYVDALGFLPPTPRQAADGGPTGDLYLRATTYTRTFESLQQMLGGLYPSQPLGSPLFRVNVRPSNHESVYPGFGCARLRPLFAHFNSASRRLHAGELDGIYAEMLGIPALRQQVETGHSSWQDRFTIPIMDTVAAVHAHALPAPAAIDDAFVTRLAQASAIEYQHSAWKSAPLARMVIGRLVHECVDHIVAAVEGDRAADDQRSRMAIYSAHDTTLGPLLAVMGSGGDPGDPSAETPEGMVWPQFASSMRIELLKDARSPYPPVRPAWEDEQKDFSQDASMVPFEKRVRPVNVPKTLYRWSPASGRTTAERNPRAIRDYYVRVWYNDRTVQLPTCRDPGAHHTLLGPSVCTLDGFFKQVARFVPSEKEAAAECRTD